MCGISGVFFSKGVEDTNIRNSINAISHRGPDESGYFYSRQCVLGMCRLAIIDVSEGQQPSYNFDRSIVSVFNGEIYNFNELKKLLQSRGREIAPAGDSALIPYLYEEFGENFCELLQGMFAIAIYDQRNQRLILIRDRLGKKPIWYQLREGLLSFSSEIKGLIALGIEKRVNTQLIPEFLQFGFINAPRSPFQDVLQVSPATIMIVKDGHVSFRKYWDVSKIKQIQINYFDAKAETERLLREAVRARLVSERPIGAFLSGGIDSTIVSGLMQQESRSNVHTFSIGFKEKAFDESSFSREIAKVIGTTHHEKIVYPDPALIVEKLAKVLDLPFADSSIIPTYLLSEFAREDVVVALSGDGGDEVFGGYERYRVARILNSINPFLALNLFRPLARTRMSNYRIRKLLQNSQRSSLQERYRGIQSLFHDADLRLTLAPDLVSDFYKVEFAHIWDKANNSDVFRKLQEVDINSYLPGDLLFKVDISSMANSLEVRSPFLDFRVVEFGLSLPTSLKFRRGESKFILREIARDLAPAKIVNRPKKGFGIPRSAWLRYELRDMVRDVLLDSTSRNRGWFQPNQVEKLLDKHDRGFDFDDLIWPMFMLELWAKNWVD